MEAQGAAAASGGGEGHAGVPGSEAALERLRALSRAIRANDAALAAVAPPPAAVPGPAPQGGGRFAWRKPPTRMRRNAAAYLRREYRELRQEAERVEVACEALRTRLADARRGGRRRPAADAVTATTAAAAGTPPGAPLYSNWERGAAGAGAAGGAAGGGAAGGAAGGGGAGRGGIPGPGSPVSNAPTPGHRVPNAAISEFAADSAGSDAEAESDGATERLLGDLRAKRVALLRALGEAFLPRRLPNDKFTLRAMPVPSLGEMDAHVASVGAGDFWAVGAVLGMVAHFAQIIAAIFDAPVTCQVFFCGSFSRIGRCPGMAHTHQLRLRRGVAAGPAAAPAEPPVSAVLDAVPLAVSAVVLRSAEPVARVAGAGLVTAGGHFWEEGTADDGDAGAAAAGAGAAAGSPRAYGDVRATPVLRAARSRSVLGAGAAAAAAVAAAAAGSARRSHSGPPSAEARRPRSASVIAPPAAASPPAPPAAAGPPAPPAGPLERAEVCSGRPAEGLLSSGASSSPDATHSSATAGLAAVEAAVREEAGAAATSFLLPPAAAGPAAGPAAAPAAPAGPTPSHSSSAAPSLGPPHLASAAKPAVPAAAETTPPPASWFGSVMRTAVSAAATAAASFGARGDAAAYLLEQPGALAAVAPSAARLEAAASPLFLRAGSERDQVRDGVRLLAQLVMEVHAGATGGICVSADFDPHAAILSQSILAPLVHIYEFYKIPIDTKPALG